MITGRKTLWGWVAILALIVVAACAPVVETESEAAAYPARAMATTTLPPYPWPTQPPPPTDEPPPTEPPVPTLPPTPVVTPIPTAAPPIIPFPDGTAAQPFTLYWRDGDVIRSLRSEGQEEPSVFLDPVKEFGLYLPPEDIYLPLWGAISPDGNLALVLTDKLGPDTLAAGPYPAHIYLMDQKSRELRLLVKYGVEPVWSPDGKRLAYRSMETGGLWVADAASGIASEVYAPNNAGGHFATGFSWAPNNRHLVMIDEVLYESTDLLIVDTNQQEAPRKLEGLPTEWAYNAQWSPTGEQISFTSAIAGPGGWQLQIANLSGERNQLAGEVYPVSGVPHWSPNGEWIAFGGVAIYEASQYQTDLWLTDTVGKSLIRLTYDEVESQDDTQAEDSRPIWSPDGTQLVFRKGQEVWSISLLDSTQRKLFSIATTSDIGLTITQ